MMGGRGKGGAGNDQKGKGKGRAFFYREVRPAKSEVAVVLPAPHRLTPTI